MRWVGLVLAVAALATVALTGFVTFWDDDAGEDVFVLDIDRSAMVIFVLLGVLVLTIVMSSWRSSAPIIAVVVAFAAATMILLIRRTTLSGADEVNDYLAVEGGSGGQPAGPAPTLGAQPARGQVPRSTCGQRTTCGRAVRRALQLPHFLARHRFPGILTGEVRRAPVPRARSSGDRAGAF